MAASGFQLSAAGMWEIRVARFRNDLSRLRPEAGDRKPVTILTVCGNEWQTRIPDWEERVRSICAGVPPAHREPAADNRARADRSNRHRPPVTTGRRRSHPR